MFLRTLEGLNGGVEPIPLRHQQGNDLFHLHERIVTPGAPFTQTRRTASLNVDPFRRLLCGLSRTLYRDWTVSPAVAGTGILENIKEAHMEHLIAKLLHDFEKGFMNRRQLIQSLALAVTAAAPAGVALAQNPAQNSSAAPAAGAPAPAHSPGFKTVELDHISYQVKDYRVTRDFYADLMGMEVANDNGKTQCELHFRELDASRAQSPSAR